MDRGSRVVNFFQNLEKLLLQKAPKLCVEDVQQLRYISSKLLQYMSSHEKINRDVVLKNPSYIEMLLAVLKITDDDVTLQNIVYILHELIGKSHSGKLVNALVVHGTTHSLLQLLVTEAHRPTASEDLIFSIHHILLKLAPKDRKFAVKARLCQALGVSVSLIRAYISSPKLLQPIIHVFKFYCSNAVNASHLGKHGAVSLLYRVLSVCGRKHLILLKYTVDSLVHLVKTKSNAARAVGQGGVAALLAMHYEWHRADTKHRHIPLRKAILAAIRNVTNISSGRDAFTEADGVHLLYMTSLELLDVKELENCVMIASGIMRKCSARSRLPVTALQSPLTHPLPQSDFQVQTNQGEGSGYESSVDNDDDLSSDDGNEARKLDSDEDECDVLKEEVHRRTSEDLSMYAEFFPELTHFDSLLDDPCCNGSDPIIVPTDNPDPRRIYHIRDENQTLTHSTSDLQSANQNFGLQVRKLFPEQVSNSIANLKLTDTPNQLDSPLMPRPQSMLCPPEMLSQKPDIYLDASSSASSNGKNGGGGFSLDMSSKITKKVLHNKSPKVKRKNLKCKPGKMDKRGRTKCKVDSESSDEDEPVSDVVSSDYDVMVDNTALFVEIAERTKSVGRFNKLAYPDMHGSVSPTFKEPLYEKRAGTQRQKIFEDIDRFLNPSQIIDRVVYDLDHMITSAGPTYTSVYSMHTNDDEDRVSQPEVTDTDHLRFNSQFECGNLRKVIQVRQYEYDLILSPDINTNHHHQWFYFEVSHMEVDVKYRFNIINCEKLNSQLNFGMKPVMYSVAEAMAGRPCWTRVGTEICYYKNHFLRSSQTTGGVRGKMYYTGTFTITFNHAKDVCYLAYHYPYSYTMLQYHIQSWESTIDHSRIFYRNQQLTESVVGNPIPVLTITSQPVTCDSQGVTQLKNRPYIFLSSRVHPGESNSSWVMKGTIDFLLSDKTAAQSLRDMFIFKVVPMLNPDGVINGNHRCSVVTEDLNRRWLRPCPSLHPTIYHTKGLLQYLNTVNKTPLVFCDYHGHSRRKNVFLYGCSPSLSWVSEDLANPAYISAKMEDTGYKTLPKILQQIAPAFSLSNCNYMVEKSKESTARVVVWRQIGVLRSYTMESTYCGCDIGPYKGLHITVGNLAEMGRKFCEGLAKIKSRRRSMASSPPISSADLNSAAPDEPDIPPDVTDEAAFTVNGPELEDEVQERSSTSSDVLSSDEDDEDDDDDNDDDDDVEDTSGFSLQVPCASAGN